jgi:hypothetical protein
MSFEEVGAAHVARDGAHVLVWRVTSMMRVRLPLARHGPAYRGSFSIVLPVNSL